MRTTRSLNYYKQTHGLCKSPDNCCRYKTRIHGIVYCGDGIGEKSDFCRSYDKPIGELCSFAWVENYENWNDVKTNLKQTRDASFILPLVFKDGKFQLGNPRDYEDSVKDVGEVIYTTDEKIKELYGTKMEYYSYSFLRNEFQNELSKYLKTEASDGGRK